jgi:uncharacterized protein YbjT (DUF2867 family)
MHRFEWPAEDFSGLVAGADAMVFAVGAGPGSGVARKDTVDRAAAVLMASAAAQAGVRRFVQVSSMGAGQRPQPGRGAVWAAYMAAKTAAEDDLRARDLDWTIARRGGLAAIPGGPDPARTAASAAGHDSPRRRRCCHRCPAGLPGDAGPDF